MKIKKYKLYDTEAEWQENNSAIESYLGIPTEDTLNYSVLDSVVNPSNADYGKFILPVTRYGPWKCDDQFSGELVDFDPSWYSVPQP